MPRRYNQTLRDRLHEAEPHHHRHSHHSEHKHHKKHGHHKPYHITEHDREVDRRNLEHGRRRKHHSHHETHSHHRSHGHHRHGAPSHDFITGHDPEVGRDDFAGMPPELVMSSYPPNRMHPGGRLDDTMSEIDAIQTDSERQIESRLSHQK